MAEALYAGMVDDTGNFRFSNSTPKVHHAAADLIEQGVAPARIYKDLYQTATPAKLQLLGRAWAGSAAGRGPLRLLAVTRDDLAAAAPTMTTWTTWWTTPSSCGAWRSRPCSPKRRTAGSRPASGPGSGWT